MLLDKGKDFNDLDTEFKQGNFFQRKKIQVLDKTSNEMINQTIIEQIYMEDLSKILNLEKVIFENDNPEL